MRPGDHRPSDRNYSRFGRRVFLALPDAGLSIGAERLVLSRKGLFEREKSGATQFGSEFFRTLSCGPLDAVFEPERYCDRNQRNASRMALRLTPWPNDMGTRRTCVNPVCSIERFTSCCCPERAILSSWPALM